MAEKNTIGKGNGICRKLKQSFTLHADILRIADDDVVEDFYAEQFSRFHQPFVQADVYF